MGQEFFAYLASPSDPEQLDRLFVLYDKDKDGQVSLGGTVNRHVLHGVPDLFQELLITLGIFCNGTVDQNTSVRDSCRSRVVRSS